MQQLIYVLVTTSFIGTCYPAPNSPYPAPVTDAGISSEPLSSGANLLQDMESIEVEDGDMPEHLRAVTSWASETSDDHRMTECTGEFSEWHPYLCAWFVRHERKANLVNVINQAGGPYAFCAIPDSQRQHAAFCARVSTMTPAQGVARPQSEQFSTSRAMNAILHDIVKAVAIKTGSQSLDVMLDDGKPGPESIPAQQFSHDIDIAGYTALEVVALLLLVVALIALVAIAACIHFRIAGRSLDAGGTSEIEKQLSLTADSTI